MPSSGEESQRSRLQIVGMLDYSFECLESRFPVSGLGIPAPHHTVWTVAVPPGTPLDPQTALGARPLRVLLSLQGAPPDARVVPATHAGSTWLCTHPCRR